MRTTMDARVRLMIKVCLWLMIAVGVLWYCLGLKVECVHSASIQKSSRYTPSVTVQEDTIGQDLPTYSRDQNEHPNPVVPEIVEQVVAAESRGEPIEGQMAVAQTVRETAQYYNLSYEDVALSDKYTDPVSYDEVTQSIKEACYRVLYLEENAVDEPIMWFYSTAGGFYSDWHETSDNLEYVCTIGQHKFYKLKEDQS